MSLAALRAPRYLGFALVYILLATGCAGFSQPLGPLGLLLQSPPEPPAPGAKKVTVEVHPENARPERIELALEDGDSVDTALQKSRVVSRFGAMKINVYRPSGKPGGPIHPLKVEYDAGRGQVPPQYDYALRDGDRIVVSEDPTTAFDRMMGAILGPLRG